MFLDKKKALESQDSKAFLWLREKDKNLRPFGLRLTEESSRCSLARFFRPLRPEMLPSSRTANGRIPGKLFALGLITLV